MRWLWLVVLAACTRPQPPQCPVCALAVPVAKTAPPTPPAEDPQKLDRACAVVQNGIDFVSQSLQLLAHEAAAEARVIEPLEKQQHKALQAPLERTVAAIRGVRPGWAFVVFPKRVAASSPNAPSLGVLEPLMADRHTRWFMKHDGEWQLFVGSAIQATNAGGILVLWRDTAFLEQLGMIANARLSIVDSAPESTCQIKIGAGHVVVDPL